MRISSLSLVAGIAAAFIPAVAAHPALEARQSGSSQGFAAPSANGGSQLTQGTASGQGEPLNVIISSQSDPSVLSQAGFEEWARSVSFSPGSCAGITLGTPQQANLGDGNGAVSQTNLFRYNYMQGDGGSCVQSLNGGNHFRYWIQNGSAANTGAIFLAASVELNAQQNHMIAPNGYDDGRDQLVGNATRSGGTTSPGGFKYETTSTDDTSLMSGISTSQINHGIGTDGVVKILTITVTQQGTIGAGRDQNSTGTGTTTSTPQSGSMSLMSNSGKSALVAASSALAVVCGSLLLI